MKKIILSTALLALAGAAHADLIKVAVNGGYTTVTMAEANASIDKAKASGATVTGLNSGWFVAGEAGISLMPFLEIGPRVEYLKTNTGDITTPSGKTTFDGNLTSYMLGVNTGMDLPLTGLGFNAGVYGGYGMAAINSNVAAAGSTGGAFVGEIQAKLKYSIFPLVSIDLLGGLRFANMGKMKDSAGKDTTDGADFSGLNAGGGLTVGF
jgi:hypothetical protein